MTHSALAASGWLSGQTRPQKSQSLATEEPGDRWALPLGGGLLVTLLVVVWSSSSLWYFNNSRLPLP